MHEFEVPDMTCGHCASTITKALKAEDPTSQVEVDLARRRVKVRSALPGEALRQHIADAGYSPASVGGACSMNSSTGI